MVVAGLMNPAYLVEMTFVAMAGRRAIGFRDTATSGDALAWPAMRAGSHVFLTATEPTGPSADTDAHARAAANHLVALLQQAGLGWADVADVTLHVSDAAHAAVARRALRDAGAQPLPAGTTLVCGLLPQDARLQISVVAAD